jgi:hypothetical protein
VGDVQALPGRLDGGVERIGGYVAEDPQVVPYSAKKTVLAGLRRGGLAVLAIAGAAVLQAFQSEVTLKQILGETPLMLALIPAIVGAASAYANWSKNKDR